MDEHPLEIRFRRHLADLLAGDAEPPRLLLALSGGLDSTVLLYLLRFRAREIPFELSAAHFDHRMREGSGADAAWVRGLCRAWEVPLVTGAAAEPISSETAARRARYEFLRATAEPTARCLILTAHHADDQAETVFFRIVRGTGIEGLRGIAPRTRSGLLRPLLPFWREELSEYAERRDLRWRDDPTNLSHGPARNRIRNLLLPDIERNVAPGARRSLVSLAALARETEEGLRALIAPHRDRIVMKEENSISISRSRLRECPDAVAARIVRDVLREFGSVPGRIGTRSALTFITDAHGGREMQLPDGVRIRIEYDVARVERTSPAELDRPLRIPELEFGEVFVGEAIIGGRRLRVEARLVRRGEIGEPRPGAMVGRIPATLIRFPVTLRGREAGDRVQRPEGRRSLKRLMIDRRVPRSQRERIPVLADASGNVLWVPDLAEPRVPMSPDEPILYLECWDERRG